MESEGSFNYDYENICFSQSAYKMITVLGVLEGQTHFDSENKRNKTSSATGASKTSGAR